MLVSVLLVSACTGPAPEDGAATETTPSSAAMRGTYQVTSQFEVPATVAAPGPIDLAQGSEEEAVATFTAIRQVVP